MIVWVLDYFKEMLTLLKCEPHKRCTVVYQCADKYYDLLHICDISYKCSRSEAFNQYLNWYLNPSLIETNNYQMFLN